MNRILHITSGDCAGEILTKADIGGEIFVWHDILYDGPRNPGWPDDDTFGWGTINTGNVVELTVELPANSSLLPRVTLLDSSGAEVADLDGEPADGHFRAEVATDGDYYARVQSF